MKIKVNAKLIIIILFGMSFLGGLIPTITKQGNGMPIAEILIILVIEALLIFSYIKDLQKQQDFDNNNKFQFQHSGGLNYPQNATVNITVLEDKLSFLSNNVTYDLKNSKILNVNIQSHEEIQKQLVSNPGSALAGAAMFGAVGAIVGGAATEQKIKTLKNLLVITYLKDDKPDYIVFSLPENEKTSKDKLTFKYARDFIYKW